MVHSPKEIIQQYIIASGQGVASSSPTNTDWKTFRYKLPDDTSVNAIGVYDTSPVPDGRDMKSPAVIEHPGVMVEVRAATPDGGDHKIRQVEAALLALKNTLVTITVAGTPPTVYSYYVTFSKTSGPVPVGEDDRHRHSFTLNGTVTIYDRS